MYSLSMLEHVQSTHEHSTYSMISMVRTNVVPGPGFPEPATGIEVVQIRIMAMQIL
jgi:hypothetical protein